MSLSSNHHKTWSSWELPFLFFLPLSLASHPPPALTCGYRWAKAATRSHLTQWTGTRHNRWWHFFAGKLSFHSLPCLLILETVVLFRGGWLPHWDQWWGWAGVTKLSSSICDKNFSLLKIPVKASLPSFLSSSQAHWTGLTDQAVEGSFVWQTSYTGASYTFWGSGEPTNNNECGEDCVHLVRAKWTQKSFEMCILSCEAKKCFPY